MRRWFSLTSAFLICGISCSLSIFIGVTATVVGSPEQPPDRYAENKLIFIGELEDQPVFLVLTFSRGTSERDGHAYAAECTGHLFRRGRWLHIGPGGYPAPETTLAVIPSGPGFAVSQAANPPIFSVDFKKRMHPVRLVVDRLDYLHGDTTDADYRLIYRVGIGRLGLDTDTIAGTILCRDIDFTGYNRLAGNTYGYFPGKYELAVLTASDGSVFVLSTDPVSARDPDNRVQANFAACYLVDGGAEIIFDSLATRWPAVDDTLYPGKPLPSRWVTTVEGGKWQAEYDDIGHFFYFTGFGIFGVQGIMRCHDTTYQVSGVVEHIHARDGSR